MKKSKILLIVVALLALVCLAACGNAASASAATETQEQPGVISVTGEGEIYAKPDMASVVLGVTSRAKTVKEAQADNSTKMAAVLTAIKALGIAEDDIQTTEYNIYPQYSYSDSAGQKLTGYQVENTIRVKVRKIADTGSVIDAAVDKGANVSYNISFEVSNYDTLYKQALASAVTAAQEKAQAIAKAAGISNIKAKAIAESGSSTPILYRENMKNMAAADQASGASIEPGSMKVSAQVSVTYEY